MFTLVTLLTIAIGVGANSVIFSVVNGVLLKPLPYPEPEALVALWQTAPNLNIKDLESLPPRVLHLPRTEPIVHRHRCFYRRYGYNYRQQRSARTGARMDVTEGVLPSGGCAGGGPYVHFQGRDNRHPDTVLLTHSYWQRRFGADLRARSATI